MISVGHMIEEVRKAIDNGFGQVRINGYCAICPSKYRSETNVKR